MNGSAPIDRVREWLLDVNPTVSSIGMDTELLENHIINSLQLVELVLLIEEIRNEAIPDEQISREAFRTLRVIEEIFLQLPPK